MLSPSLEDYLEELYNLYKNDLPLRVSALARVLNVSSPSVIKGLKKLHNEGYIIYERYKGIIITPKGKSLGEVLVTRNGIIREFLTTINSDCDPIVEAEAIEHFMSSGTVESFRYLALFFKQHPEILDRYMRFKDINMQSN